MIFSDLMSFLIILLYGLGAFGSLAGIRPGKEGLRRLAALLTLAGFCLHTLLILVLLLTQNMEDLGRGCLLQLMSWCVLLVYIAGWRFLKLSFLAFSAAPLALILYVAALGAGDAQVVLPSRFSGLFFLLHIGAFFFSYAFLAAGSGAALLFLHMEHKLKNRLAFSEFDRELPAIATFDTVNRLAVTIGFPLFTLGLVSGFAWARGVWGSTVSFDPKEILSFIIWFAYAVLFHQRLAVGWRGRKTAWMLLFVFALSLASIGINFFTDRHHRFF